MKIEQCEECVGNWVEELEVKTCNGGWQIFQFESSPTPLNDINNTFFYVYSLVQYSHFSISCLLIMYFLLASFSYSLAPPTNTTRGMMDENNEQFVAYFLPTADTMAKRKEDDRAEVSYRDEEE